MALCGPCQFLRVARSSTNASNLLFSPLTYWRWGNLGIHAYLDGSMDAKEEWLENDWMDPSCQLPVFCLPEERWL